jgi:putative hemolysin
MIKKIIVPLLVLILLVCSFFLIKALNPATETQKTTDTKISGTEQSTTTTGMANPASVYCIDQGGKLSIRNDTSGGQYGICVFDDGSECDEWKFFRKECAKGMPVDAPVVDINKDTELIKLALVKEEKINLANMNVVIYKDTGKYASGGIKPKEEGVGGAYLFAAKTATGWTIVAAGNGQISCADLKPYPDLPTDMIPECADPVTGNPIQR